ncbi:unnamed protein product [Blepharisma stoltei]|uniref:Uncharacterized protein n=1 Tax=Blepharisma stoltei TaxID=1481888 RepID=A0AAU9K0C2_9CILI|nr:unnamed protein product [Blepharisma stoltei]
MNRSQSYTKVYSRFGKTLDEKFTNVKAHRKEIFFGRKPKLPTRKTDNSPQEVAKPEQVVELLKEIEKITPKNKQKTVKRLSSAFKAQGRDEYYHSVSNKDHVPHAGYYNLCFDMTRQRSLEASIPEEPKSKPRVQKEKIDIDFRVVDKPGPKTAGPISFGKQLKRQGINVFDVNEKRFESFNDKPLIHTKTRRVSTPNFNLQSGHRYLIREVLNSAIYSPKHSSVWVDTTKPILNFSKSPERKTLSNPCWVDSNYYKLNFTQVDKDVPVVDIGKNLSRPNDPHFPAFMIRNTSRNGLNMMTEKSLELNHHSSSHFFDYQSDFKSCPNSPKRSPMRSQSSSSAFNSPNKQRRPSALL